MVKTIAVSNPTYKELIKLKEEFDTKNMDEALDTLIANYKRLIKQISLKKLLEINKKDSKVTVSQLLEDRKVYGWPRKFS
jgi:predicted CopG family antitoxin